LSDDFYQRYKKENHPYPSLLDPKKLNDENEEINYNNIPAELAWEMNLPLPDRYKFVWLFMPCSGSAAMQLFFKYLNIASHAFPWEKAIKMYKDMYTYIIKDKYSIVVLSHSLNQGKNINYHKLFYMVQKKVPLLCVFRDPIERMRSSLNHPDCRNTINAWINKGKKINLNITHFENDLFPEMKYFSSDNKNRPENNMEYILSIKEIIFPFNSAFNILEKNLLYIRYLNFSEIDIENAFYTFKILSQEFNFKIPNVKSIFKAKINTHQGLLHFPVIFYEQLDDLKEINIIVTLTHLNTFSSNFINITKYFYIKNMNNIVIMIKKEHFNILQKNSRLFEKYINVISKYIEKLDGYIKNIKSTLISENQILNSLKSNKTLRTKIKLILDQELKYIKQHRPDIVASWKYYQEFEKMCEELDGK
ncbi:DUF2972 domain-containing protein, partial [Campylobacter jejuni]|nr:DUF2972 domain-containing protein [Campylobacter jejuni]